jgi:DNA modification methylase
MARKQVTKRQHDCEGTSVPIGSLKQDPKNRRRHSERNLAAIKASLAEFGQQVPIVIDKRGKVIKGNGTLQEAIELGWETIKVTRSSLRGKRATAYAIADNRTAELAEWEHDGLITDLAMLDDAGLMNAAGFEQDEIDQMVADALAAPDGGEGDDSGKELEDPPIGEPPKNPITRLGDRWELGWHIVVCGSVMDGLPFADGEAQTCVTSPPYWGLRDYGEEGQLGLEKTPEEHCERMVQVFSEVRRVLRADGTCWMNYGDCYWNGGAEKRDGGHGFVDGGKKKLDAHKGRLLAAKATADGLKPKDLVGMPWMVAFALRADGWWLRQDIIWHKPNPMPESVTDRPTSAHEYLFLLAKSPRYFYDADAIREAAVEPMPRHDWESRKARGEPTRQGIHAFSRAGMVSGGVGTNPAGRNKRSVWIVTPKPYTEAHFATFPPDLIVPCIKAGTSERGRCSKCGSPWRRVVGKATGGTIGTGKWVDPKARSVSGMTRNDVVGGDQFYKDYRRGKTKGWKPTCKCSADTEPCTVLDPFMGAGTTIVVAEQLGRKAIGTELSPAYCDIIIERWQTLTGGKAKRQKG